MIAIRIHKILCGAVLIPLLAAALPSVAEEISSNSSDSLNHALAASGGEAAGLPDAPSMGLPADAQSSTTQASRTPVPQVYAPKYAKDIDPDQTTRLLSPSDKIKLSFAEQIRLYALVSVLASAGWEQAWNNDPKYGSDAEGSGKRVGAAAILQTSESIFSDGLSASVFRQDPRYYRLEHAGFIKRVVYAATRVVITRSDSGTPQLNASELVGYAGAQLLTRTYYPAISNTWGDTAAGYGLSLGGSVLGNEITEFSADAIRIVFRRSPGN